MITETEKVKITVFRIAVFYGHMNNGKRYLTLFVYFCDCFDYIDNEKRFIIY